MLTTIGRWVARRRFTVLAIWGALVVGGVVLGGGIFDNTSPIEDAPAGSESALAQARLDALDPEGEMIAAVIYGEDFFAPGVVDSASTVIHGIRDLPGVVEVNDAYTGAGLIGDDGRSSLVSIELDAALSEDEALALAADVSDALRTIEHAEVIVGGELLSEREFIDRAVMDAAIGEGVAIVALFAILIVVLGGVRVAALPIMAAIAVICVSLLLLAVLVMVMPVNEFAVNIVTIFGLGLAIDYALLVVNRFREQRHRFPDATLEDLVGVTVASSGRAVLTSGLAVLVALVGLVIVDDTLLSGMAVGGAAAVFLATLAGLTLVPALVTIFAKRVPAYGKRLWPLRSIDPDDSTRLGLLGRLASLAQRRPVLVAISSAAALGLLAAPLAGLAVGSSDIRSLPLDTEERRTFEMVVTNFADAQESAATVVIDAPVTDKRVVDLLDLIASNEIVRDADVVLDLPAEITVVDFAARGDVTGEDAQQLVHDIRSIDTDLLVTVAGPAAEVVDVQHHLLERLPFALGFVVIATLALLFALTRSFVIPVKAVILNALTVAATIGGIVAIFQWGWGAGILGFEPWGAVDVTTPLMIGLLAFGLSMDYEVFLLARIHEEWQRRDPALDPRVANDRAVLRGITVTGPVVTTAAIAIGVVFVGFASGSLLSMKEVGVGMVLAIVLDVTIVRGLLLPALMTLLGRYNWIGPRAGSPALEGDRDEDEKADEYELADQARH